MNTIVARLEQQYPASNTGLTVAVDPRHEKVVGKVRPALARAAGLEVAAVVLHEDGVVVASPQTVGAEQMGEAIGPGFELGGAGRRTREINADDVAFELMRIADPVVNSPVIDPFSNLLGFAEFSARLSSC